MMPMKQYKEVPQEPNDEIIIRQPTARPVIITTQNWMSIPVGINNCPPGLEYLTALDRLIISKRIKNVEFLSEIDTKNKFKIKNASDQIVYYAYEESDFMARGFLGDARPFEMHIVDNFKNKIMHLKRPFTCPIFCCFPCCLSSLDVCAPAGKLIGKIEETCCFPVPKYNIRNALGDVILNITGPFSGCIGNNYNIFNLNNEQIGKISKEWPGQQEDGDKYSVTFPLNLDVRMKAVIFAAAFLINVQLYEK